MATFFKGLAAAVMVLTGLSSGVHVGASHTRLAIVSVVPGEATAPVDEGLLPRLGPRLRVPPAPISVPVAVVDPAPPPAEAAPIAPPPAPADAAPVAPPPVAIAPPPAPPPAPPAPPAVVIGSSQQALINQDRAAAGLGPLTWNGCLAGVAYQNAVRMVGQGSISHAGGANQDLACGLGSTAGENVGYWSGGVNDAQLNTMFLNSAGHRANVMGGYRYVGTAWAVAPNGTAYIAVEFG